MGGSQEQGQPIKAQLSLWDAVSIIVGIVIGATIYRSPQVIMNSVTTPWMGLTVWAVGGVLAVIGALCYAELATTYPRSGGDFVYLSRAFGPWAGFLFGWAQLAVVLTASTGVMAFVFGDYAVRLWQLDELWVAPIAAAAVVALTLLNLLGVVFGKIVQNLLTAAKVIGLGAIAYAGFRYGQPEVLQQTTPVGEANIGFAMIIVLYAYGGWNDAAFVAAEVRNRRNIARALLLGTAGITVIYLVVNAAYLMALGFDGVRQSRAVAAEVLAKLLGEEAGKGMSVLVMVSALGAVNGLIFTGSRVYSTLGQDYKLFAWLGRWHPRFGSPVWALAVQALISVAMIAGVGTELGRQTIDQSLTLIGLSPLPWEKYFGGFETLLAGSAPVFWGFFLLTGLSLFALRMRDPDIERPFAAPLFPWLPLVFCGTCFYMLRAALDYAGNLALIGALPLLLGVPLYELSRKRTPPKELADSPPQ